MGINVPRTVMWAFVIAAGTGALAGIIITAMLTVPGLVDGKPLLIIAGAVGGYALAIPASLTIGNLIRKQGGMSA